MLRWKRLETVQQKARKYDRHCPSCLGVPMSHVARIRYRNRKENSIRGHDGAKERPICLRLCSPWGDSGSTPTHPQ